MTLVVKLGSSIVAADDGELRADVLDAVCEQVAALEQGGERVVMVTSGAIARGMRLMELPVRPRAMDELQAASAVGQGDLFRAYEQRLAGARDARGPGAADRRRHRRPHQLPERAPDPAPADRVGRGPGRQRERHHRHRRDHLRRQRLPRRPGRDPARRPPARPAHQRRRRLQRRSRRRRGRRRWSSRSRTSPSSTAWPDRRPHLGLRLRRDAQQGRRRRDGERGRDPGDDLQRDRGRHARRGRRRRARSAPASPRRAARPRASSSGSSTRSRPTAGCSSTRARPGSCARAARACCRSGSPRVEGDFEAGDAVEVAADGAVVGKGIVDYSAAELVAGDRHEERRGPRAAPARGRRGDPPRPLRVARSASQNLAGSPSVGRARSWLPLADGCDHHNGRRGLRSREAGRARPRQRLHRGQGRRAGGDREAARRAQRARSSRRTPPTSPTSAPPA